MKKISLFILSAFLVSALSSKSAQAQSACNGTLFGIPVCTGFCFDKQDDVKKKERIKRLRHEADSLNKEANKLSDSLKGENDFFNKGERKNFFGQDFFKDAKPSTPQFLDPAPNTIQGNTNDSPLFEISPEELDRFQIPQIPKVAPYDDQKNPMKNFKGWYLKKLETAELVK